MDWKTLPVYFALGGFGAFVVELIKLYELRGKLQAHKISGLMRSKTYRVLALGMICSAGILAWILNARVPLVDADLVKVMLSGMGACAVLRDMYAAKIQNAPPNLGPRNEGDISLKELV